MPRASSSGTGSPTSRAGGIGIRFEWGPLQKEELDPFLGVFLRFFWCFLGFFVFWGLSYLSSCFGELLGFFSSLVTGCFSAFLFLERRLVLKSRDDCDDLPGL